MRDFARFRPGCRRDLRGRALNCRVTARVGGGKWPRAGRQHSVDVARTNSPHDRTSPSGDELKLLIEVRGDRGASRWAVVLPACANGFAVRAEKAWGFGDK